MTNNYRMPDQQIVTILLPVGIVRKLKDHWSALDIEEKQHVRNAMQHALWDEAND
jgi:hypothetical protein